MLHVARSRLRGEEHLEYRKRILETAEHEREVAHVGGVLTRHGCEPGRVSADGFGYGVEGFGGDDLKQAEDFAAVLPDVL